MKIKWEWWPKPIDGEQGDPCSQEDKVEDMESAEKFKHNLHNCLGDRLISVDITTRIFGDRKD